MRSSAPHLTQGVHCGRRIPPQQSSVHTLGGILGGILGGTPGGLFHLAGRFARQNWRGIVSLLLHPLGHPLGTLYSDPLGFPMHHPLGHPLGFPRTPHAVPLTIAPPVFFAPLRRLPQAAQFFPLQAFHLSLQRVTLPHPLPQRRLRIPAGRQQRYHTPLYFLRQLRQSRVLLRHHHNWRRSHVVERILLCVIRAIRGPKIVIISAIPIIPIISTISTTQSTLRAIAPQIPTISIIPKIPPISAIRSFHVANEGF